MPHSVPARRRRRVADVALCLCGQFRDHSHAVFPSLNRTLLSLPNLSVSVFVDTWDKLGESRCHGRRCKSPPPHGAQLPIDYRWMSMFRTLAWLRVERLPANASLSLHGLEMPGAVALAEPNHYQGTLPNLWKMQGCADAIRESEAERDRAYQAVVKMRPDGKFFNANELASLMRSLHTVIAGGAGTAQLYHSKTAINITIQVSDKYAVGTSSAMQYYLSAWGQARPIWEEWMRQGSIRGDMVPVGERLMQAHMRNASFAFAVY
jgi:hypothetical protein